MDVCKQFFRVINTALGDDGKEHAEQLTAHSNNGLFLLQRGYFSGSIVVVQRMELRVAFHQRERRSEQDGPKSFPAAMGDAGSSFVLAGFIYFDRLPGELLHLPGRVEAPEISGFRQDSSYGHKAKTLDFQQLLYFRDLGAEQFHMCHDLVVLPPFCVIIFQQQFQFQSCSFETLLAADALFCCVNRSLRPLFPDGPQLLLPPDLIDPVHAERDHVAWQGHLMQ